MNNPILQDFITLTKTGLYCSYGNFYLDPQEPVLEAVISHAHGDHASDAARLAQKLGIKVHCIHELSEWLNGQGVETVGFGKGGTLHLNGTKVTMVHAVHSASIDFGGKGLLPAGDAAGFMIAGEGHTIYLSGDTDIMADMAWMAEYHQPDIGILSCGGHYTMDMARAAYAAKRYFNFKTVIPCHYRTFGGHMNTVAIDLVPLRGRGRRVERQCLHQLPVQWVGQAQPMQAHAPVLRRLGLHCHAAHAHRHHQ